MRRSALNPKQPGRQAGVNRRPLPDPSRGCTVLARPWQHGIALALGAGLAASLWLGPVHAKSYPTQYIPTGWTTEQGLPQNSVNALLQDHQGYLWLGTFSGLARFDGMRFTLFDTTNVPGFGDYRVISLHESRSGALWIGTMDGLVRLDSGVATRYTERDGLPGGFISSIREDAGGNLWINTSGGIARFTGKKFEAYPAHRGQPVREFFLQTRDGSMWFRFGENVLRFGADGSVAKFEPPKKSVFLVEEARDGSVWIAFRDQYLLARYSQGAFSEVPLPPVPTLGLTGQPVFSLGIAKDKDGELLLITPAGVIRIVDGKLGPLAPVRLPAGDGQTPKLRSFLIDREGDFWVGTMTTGLVRLRPAPLTAYGKEEGLANSSFYAVFQDREGRIWLGGDSVYWFDGQRFYLLPGLIDIRAITQTREGDLWFGGFGGLYRWRSGVLSNFHIDARPVSAIYQDRQGTLWVGAAKEERAGGLFRFQDGKLRQIPGISDVHRIVEGRDGALRVGGLEGIFHVSADKAVPDSREVQPRIVDIDEDPSGSLWLTTFSEGLIRFRDGRFKALTTRDGLPSNAMACILDDHNGNLWISSRDFLRLSSKELNAVADGRTSYLSPVSYGMGEGLRSSEINAGSPGIWKASDGRIWFPTLHGVVAIDPNAVSESPPVVLEEATANHLPLRRDGRTSAPPGHNTFDFQFTALSLSAPEKLRFKYRLEPYDREWKDAGTGRTAHYTNMAPGEYSFRVIAANSFGVWNDKGAGVSFALRPHFYQTSWFYALCAGVLMTLLWAAYQFRVRQLRRAFNMRLHERIEERTRIARELHDTLLQSFQGSLYKFQAARNLFARRPEEALNTLDSAIARAENALAEGRDAIQNLRARGAESRLEDLLNSTGQELAGAQDGTGDSSVFRVSLEGQPRSLSPLFQDEIYRIAREILRNAFQHAHARRIEAAIQYDRHLFRLRIRDDGKGIDPKVLEEGARAGHWGLPGIRERAKRIGAQLRLWSESGAGTEFELTVPARIAYPSAHLGHGLQLFRKRKGEA